MFDIFEKVIIELVYLTILASGSSLTASSTFVAVAFTWIMTNVRASFNGKKSFVKVAVGMNHVPV